MSGVRLFKSVSGSDRRAFAHRLKG